MKDTIDKLESPEIPSEATDKQEFQIPKRNITWFWMILAIPLAVAGGFFWRGHSGTSPQTPQAIAQKPTTPPRAVETVAISTGNAVRRIQLLGRVEPSEQSIIRAQTGGVVQQILVNPGDRITPGRTIAILDSADQQLALSQAEAQLAQQRSNLARLEVGTRPEIIAQRQATVRAFSAREKEAQDNLRRTANLVREGAISRRLLVEAQAAVDEARAERLAAQATLAEAQAGPIREEIAAQRSSVAAAVAAVNQARLALQRTRITASSSGVVQERRVSAGDLLQSGGELVSLVGANQLDVFLELPEDLSGRVATGSRVELTARALPQWRGIATITGVVPTANATSRRQQVRVRLNNPPPGLLPGMAVTGTLISQASVPGNRSTFVVSRDALTKRQNQWLVFTVDGGVARQLEVEMVADMGEQVAISHPDLRTGQQIVIRGGDSLTNGASVRVVGGAS